MTQSAPDPIAEALARYAAAAKSDLPSAHAVRQRVRHRQRRRRGAGATAIALVAVFSLSLWLAAPSGSPVERASSGTVRPGLVTTLESKVARADPSNAAGAERVALAEQSFALKLTAAFAKESTGSENVVVSPAGIDATLAMLEIGAAGATEREIAAALGSLPASPAEQALGWDALAAQLAKDAAGATLVDASGIVLQEGFPVRSEYLDLLQRNFGAGVEETDFHDPATASAAIGAWLRTRMGPGFPSALPPDDLSPNTVAVLVNALKFEAAWAPIVSFGSVASRRVSFTTATERHVPVSMMETRTLLPFKAAGDFDAVVLPYAASSCEAVAILPDTGVSPTSVLSSLTPAELESIGSAPLTGLVLGLPKFTIGSGVSLGAALGDLGMSGVFSPAADFSRMTPRPVAVESAVQDDVLAVDEKGTGTEATTKVAQQPSSAHGELSYVTFDRPFLFIIRDKATGTIISVAVVANPGSPS